MSLSIHSIHLPPDLAQRFFFHKIINGNESKFSNIFHRLIEHLPAGPYKKSLSRTNNANTLRKKKILSKHFKLKIHIKKC